MGVLKDFFHRLSHKKYDNLDEAYEKPVGYKEAYYLTALYSDAKHADDTGHGIEHIIDVTTRARLYASALQKQGIEVDIDKAISSAAYHDIGNFIERGFHEMHSFGILNGELTVQDVIQHSKLSHELLTAEERAFLLANINSPKNINPTMNKVLTAAYAAVAEFRLVYEENPESYMTEDDGTRKVAIRHGIFQKPEYKIDYPNFDKLPQSRRDIINDQRVESALKNIPQGFHAAVRAQMKEKTDDYNASHHMNMTPSQYFGYNRLLQNVTQEFRENYPTAEDRKDILFAVIDHRIDKEKLSPKDEKDAINSGKDMEHNYEPHSIYGKIVYDADKEELGYNELARSVAYSVSHGCIGINKVAAPIAEFMYRHRSGDAARDSRLLQIAIQNASRMLGHLYNQDPVYIEKQLVDMLKIDPPSGLLKDIWQVSSMNHKKGPIVFGEPGLDTYSRIDEMVKALGKDDTEIKKIRGRIAEWDDTQLLFGLFGQGGALARMKLWEVFVFDDDKFNDRLEQNNQYNHSDNGKSPQIRLFENRMEALQIFAPDLPAFMLLQPSTPINITGKNSSQDTFSRLRTYLMIQRMLPKNNTNTNKASINPIDTNPTKDEIKNDSFEMYRTPLEGQGFHETTYIHIKETGGQINIPECCGKTLFISGDLSNEAMFKIAAIYLDGFHRIYLSFDDNHYLGVYDDNSDGKPIYADSPDSYYHEIDAAFPLYALDDVERNEETLDD